MLSEELSALAKRIDEVKKKTLFFIGGVPKSGTTWVERICDAHPNVACKGEAHFGSLLQPTLTKAFVEYNGVIAKKGNWGRHALESGHDVPVEEYQFLVGDVQALLGQAILLMLQRWHSSPRIQCIGEKTPSNALFFNALEHLFPEARFIYLVRDPRDVIVSGWFFNNLVDPSGQQNGSLEEYVKLMTREWTTSVTKALTFINSIGERGMYIRYEDLLEKPDTGIEELFYFLGVDYSGRIISQVKQATDFSQLSGGRQSGEENRSSFYRKGIAGDWRNHLDSSNLLRINSECGNLLEWFGYPLT